MHFLRKFIKAGDDLKTETLEYYAEAFLLENFNLPLNISVRISKRMKSKLGAFQIKYKNKSVYSKEIVMSYNFIVHNDQEAILDVLYHECVHYALYTLNKPFRDSDAEFIQTLDALGISKTRSYHYKGNAYLYECPKCGYQFTKKVKGYNKRYICRYCRSKFVYRREITA